MTSDTKLWDPDRYDEHSRLQETIANLFLNRLKRRFSLSTEHSYLLDIGCGSGRVSQFILNTFPGVSITGIDTSQEMIDFASRHFQNPRMSFRLDKAEELKSIPTLSMDAITSFSCLHWVQNHPAAFRAMQRVLKPGGWLGVMLAAETGFDDPIDRVYAQAINEEPWKSYFANPIQQLDWNISEPKVLKAQLEECGLKVLDIDALNFDYYFDDRKTFESWISASFQQLKILPKQLQESCSQRIAELYLQVTIEQQPTGKRCIYKIDALMLMAQKSD